MWAGAQETSGTGTDTGTESETEAETPAQQQGVPAPPPSIEEILVLGVESESAADFSDADSVIGFNAQDLAAIGAESIEDIALFTPNLEIVTAGATTPTFFIRGVGLNDFNPTSTGAVSIYQDDIAVNTGALQLGTLFDTEAVNVERGPLGTGQGRNASAGAIRTYSRKPTGEYGGYLRADFGNYNFMDYEGAVEAPIVEDMLSSRLAFRLSQRDGFMKNHCANAPPFDQRQTYPGLPAFANVVPWSICGEEVRLNEVSQIPTDLKEWTNDTDNWAARGTLRFEPTLDMTWLVNGHGSKRDELSRLGQSIGTGGFFCPDPTALCAGGGIPPGQRTTASNGVLGGAVDGTVYSRDYIPREIFERLVDLAPCFGINPGSCTNAANRVQANNAKIKLADELSKDLDSEPWEGDFNRTGPTHNSTWGSFVSGEIGLPADFQLTTHSGYDAYDRVVDIDLDQSPETLFQIRTEDNAWQVYQDVNFGREFFSDSFPVLIDFGGFALHEDLEANVANDLGDQAGIGVGSREYEQKLWSAGGYGSFSFDFWNDFTLDGGVRYNWDRKHLEMSVFAGTVGDFTFTDTWTAPTGTLRLTYRFRDDTHWFWKYTRGWKPGTYNATASQFTGPTIADPEKIDAFETGVRGAWFDGRFTLDSSLFYYAYTDYQIFTAIQQFGGTPEFVILNANDAEVYGAEIEAGTRPLEGTYLAVRFSWLQSQFLDFVRTDQFLNPQGGTSDLVVFRETQNSGNPLLNSPKYKVSITAEQTLPLGSIGFASLRYDGAWSDTTYYDPTKGSGIGDLFGNKFLPKNTVAQPPYWIHNLRLSWRSPDERVELAGWVRNLTDQAIKTFAFDGSTFRNTTIYYVNEPRTFGGSIMVTF